MLSYKRSQRKNFYAWLFFLINKSLYFVNIIQPIYYMILHDITGTILLYIGYVKLYYYT